jgi:flagellar assembly protein FliH
MSRLWPGEGAAAAATVGSFVIARRAPVFTPLGSDGAPPPGSDHGFGSEEDMARLQAEAFSQGLEEGRRTAELELAGERDAIARLAERLEVLRPEPTNALALLLAETVDRLVREIVGAAEVDPTLLLARAKAAAALIGENVEPSKLRVHPEDAALLEAARLPVPVATDPTLARGAIVLETGHGWIEDGPEVRLERLRAELDRMGAAQ